MIKNFCDMLEIYCGHGHSEPIPMYMKEGAGYGRDSFYACPKYYPENRTPDERACNNNLTITDYLKMVDFLDKKLSNAELNDEKINLKNFKYMINPLYVNQKILNIKLDCIITTNLVHIISILYKNLKKWRCDVDGNETSNRWSYGNCDEQYKRNDRCKYNNRRSNTSTK